MATATEILTKKLNRLVSKLEEERNDLIACFDALARASQSAADEMRQGFRPRFSDSKVASLNTQFAQIAKLEHEINVVKELLDDVVNAEKV